MKINAKMMVYILSTSMVIFIISLGYIALNSRTMALDDARQLAEKTANNIKKVIESEKEFMSGIKESIKNSTVIRFVLEDIRRTAEYSSDIVEVAIDENIRNVINEK